MDLHQLAQLVSTWRSSTPQIAMQHAPPHSTDRSTCGRCLVQLRGGEPELISQRLGEALRLFATAARAGSDVFRLVYSSNANCCCLECAWCDDGDDRVIAQLVLKNAPKILHDALFAWSESCAGREFKALKGAMETLMKPNRETRRRHLTVLVQLDFDILSSLPTATNTRKLMQALATSSHRVAPIRIERLVVTCTNAEASAARSVDLLTALLGQPVPDVVELSLGQFVSMRTFVTACSTNKIATRSLACVQELFLWLKLESPDDLSTVDAFCEMLTTCFLQLKRLTIEAHDSSDTEPKKCALRTLGLALVSLPQLEFLCLGDLVLYRQGTEALMEGCALVRQRNYPLTHLSIPSLEFGDLICASLIRLEIDGPSYWEDCSRWLGNCPRLRELSLSCVRIRCCHASGEGGEYIAQKEAAWPQLRAFRAICIGNPSALFMTSQKSLTHIYLRKLTVDAVEAIANTCPELTHLNLTYLDLSAAQAIANVCDRGQLRRLRVLNVYGDDSAWDMSEFVKMLGDPTRRLTQRLRELRITTTASGSSIIWKAARAMLKENTSLATFDFRQATITMRTNTLPSPSRVWCNHVQARFQPGFAHARPSIVGLPSLRCRAALLSVLVAHDIVLPMELIISVVEMAGRHVVGNCEIW